MPLQAIQRFWKNQDDVDRLLEIHVEVAGAGAGHKHGVEVLNRATVVFITAVWESFIEDLAIESLEILLTNAKKATDIPVRVRTLASKQLKDDKDDRKVWDLADDGWRVVIKAHLAQVREEWLGSFHTPKAKQVDELYVKLLDVAKLSDCWHWNGMSVKKASDKLDRYITIRGNIAHRTKHDKNVSKDQARDFLNHVQLLVGRTIHTVREHLIGITGKEPWPTAIGRES